MTAHWKDTERLNGETAPEGKPYRLARLDEASGEISFYWSEAAGEFAAYYGKNYEPVWGTLDCASGKRMNADNRIFIADEDAAKALQEAGLCRPCAKCNRLEHQQWKASEPTVER